MLLVSGTTGLPAGQFTVYKKSRPDRAIRKIDLIQSLSDPGRMLEFTAIGRVLSTTIKLASFWSDISFGCGLIGALWPLDRRCVRRGFSVLSPAAGHRPRHAVSSPGSLPPIRWAARSPGLAPARCAPSAEITSLRL